ncbi:MAG: RHS repeat-associated core domain-containing protein, partial [Chloroflexota bacterium]
ATIDHTNTEVVYTGNWTNNAGFHETSHWSAKMALLFVGDTDVELTIGEGNDHGIFDLYIDGTLYKSIDGYAASAGSRVVALDLRGDGFHSLEIRNRHDKNMASSGYKVRFKQLAVDTALIREGIDYSYDALSRLIEADYNGSSTVYNYGYDLAGNMVNYDGVNRTYNAANQLTGDGTNTYEYDENGNLWKTNSVVSHTWDRANRLVDSDNHSYVYDGLGNRVQQTVSSVVTDYLNDVQPGLTKLLKQDDGTNTEQFVHGVRGIHAVDNGTDWNVYLQDSLGSIRALVDDSAEVQSSMSFDPYGNPMASYGAGFGFTGEQTDANGSVFLRARYYEPSVGSFIKRDPAETANRYVYVNGNPINRVDPTGLQGVETGIVILEEMWERAIQAALRNAPTYQTADDFVLAVADDVARQTGIPVGDVLPRAAYHVSSTGTLARLGALGVIVSANLTTIRGDYAGTAYDFAFGTATNITPFMNPVLSPSEQLGIYDNWIDTGTMCQIGTSDFTDIQTQTQTQPIQTQTQVQTRTGNQTSGYQVHVAFGYSEFLEDFTDNLEVQYTYAVNFNDWIDPMFFPDGIPLTPRLPHFPNEFRVVINHPKVANIHFNLEDFLNPFTTGYDNYQQAVDDFPKTSNGSCDWNEHDEYSITQWELCSLVNDHTHLLSKVIFYENGSQNLLARPMSWS